MREQSPAKQKVTRNYIQQNKTEHDVANAEITNLSMEISPQFKQGNEPGSGKDSLSASSHKDLGQEVSDSYQSKDSQSRDKYKKQKSGAYNDDKIAKKNIELDLSALSGLMNQQKIQAYEAILQNSEKSARSPTKKHQKSNKRKRSDFSEFNKLINERKTIESKIAQIREQEKSLFESEESIPLPNAMVSNPNTTGSHDKQLQDDIQFDEDDTALDDMDQSPAAVNENNPLNKIAKESISIPQNSPSRFILGQNEQSSHSSGSYRYSGGAIYKSNQPMNIKSKNSTYFSKNNEYLSSTNHQFTQDEEDCNSVNSQDERQLNKQPKDEIQTQDENVTQRKNLMTPHRKYTQNQVSKQSDNSLINNVNVIDLRALSPGMRHIASQNKAFNIQKKAAMIDNYAKSGKKLAKSPQIDQTLDQNFEKIQVTEQSLNTGNISQDMLQEHLEVKKFQMRKQQNPPGEKRWSPMFQPHQRILKKPVSPMAQRDAFANARNANESSKSPMKQDSPQQSQNKVAPPNQSQQKRHSMQNAIRQNNRQFKAQLANPNRHSNITGCNVSTNAFNNKPQNVYNRNTSDSGSGLVENNSPIMKSMELKSAKTKKQDGQSSKNFFGSFFYNQQSIGPGSIVSGSEYTPPPADGLQSPKIEDPKKRVTVNSSTSNSSYNKFKNFLYNTVKTAQVNYHSKTSMNLKDKYFFGQVKDRDTKTMLLHNKYINKKSFSSQDLEHLNQRFTIDWRGITWFSYRDQIERPIGSKGLSASNGLKSDHGWGCMLRTGQMILFQALIRHFMNDMSYVEIFQDQKCIQRYFDLLMFFMDNSPPHDLENITCPFGIHSICQEAKENLQMDPGQWYGPQMISIVLRNICNKKRPVNQFRMHVCLDGCLFLDEIEALLNQSNSVFVLIPLRLGMDNISPVYLKQLKYLFQLNQSVGIMGGKDHMAIYLIGDEDVQKNNSGLFYLDPHYVQPSVPRAQLEKHLGSSQSASHRFHLSPQHLDTYHTYDLRTLDPTNMQTSLAPGFYIRDHENFKKLVRQLKEMHSHFRDQCIFTIYDQKPQWMRDLDSQPGSPSREKEDEEEQVQDLGPMRVKASPQNTSQLTRKKGKAQDDSFEDLKDYEFEGIEHMTQNRKKPIIQQKIQIQQKTLIGMQASESVMSKTTLNLQKPLMQLSQNQNVQKMRNLGESFSNQSRTQPLIMEKMETPTNSSNLFASSSLYGKTGDLHSSTQSRGSDKKDHMDIDSKLISIGGNKLLDMSVNEPQSMMMTQKLPKQIKSHQLLNPNASQRMQNLDRSMQNSTPERQVSSRGAKRIIPNMPQQLMKQANNSGQKRPQQMMNSQVIGPRTMMNLNQGKYSSKIGHMQDTGMVNPKNRHSRMKANAAGTAKGNLTNSSGFHALGQTQSNLAHARQRDSSSSQRVAQFNAQNQVKSRSDVQQQPSRNTSTPSALQAMPSSSTLSRPNPNPQQPSPITISATTATSAAPATPSPNIALPNSKSSPEIQVTGAEMQADNSAVRQGGIVDPKSGQVLKPVDSIILGNIDESEERGEIVGALPNTTVHQDQLMMNRSLPNSASTDALRIHNISAYGTKLKQKLQNFRERSRKGSGSNVTPRGGFGKKLKDNSFDQDVGVMPQQSSNNKNSVDDESDDFEKI